MKKFRVSDTVWTAGRHTQDDSLVPSKIVVFTVRQREGWSHVTITQDALDLTVEAPQTSDMGAPPRPFLPRDIGHETPQAPPPASDIWWRPL